MSPKTCGRKRRARHLRNQHGYTSAPPGAWARIRRRRLPHGLVHGYRRWRIGKHRISRTGLRRLLADIFPNLREGPSQ